MSRSMSRSFRSLRSLRSVFAIASVLLALMAGVATASAHAGPTSTSGSVQAQKTKAPCVASQRQVMTAHGPATLHTFCFFPKGDTSPLDATSCSGITVDWKSGGDLFFYGYAACQPQTDIEEEMQGVTCTRQIGSGCENWIFSFTPFPDPYCDSVGEVFNLRCPEVADHFDWQSVPTGHLVNGSNTLCAVINGSEECEYIRGNWIQY